jgi:SAM-dependent methyltransferase
MTDKIEILSVELLDQHRPQVEAFRALSAELNIGLGWHYLLDLVWILDNLGDPHGKWIMDAGAGLGLMQWYLLEHGAAEVISADRGDRSEVTLRMRARYNIHGLRQLDLKPAPAILRKNINTARGGQKIVSALLGVGGLFLVTLPKNFHSRLLIYNQDLLSMPEIVNDSLDAVVAVSALEHNPPGKLEKVVTEIMHKLKPGGKLIATLGAAKTQDWFHEPSRGWNYTEKTIRQIFGIGPAVNANYARYDGLFTALKGCAELRDHLAPFYFKSSNNGMPWGKWEPQYQPVGICKTKTV